MSKIDMDELLRSSLGSSEAPSRELNERVKIMIKERVYVNKKAGISLKFAIVAAVILIFSSIAVYAAVRLLTPSQVAERLGREQLAQVFENEGAILVNQTVASGGYNITLLGVAFGKDLTDFYDDADRDKTYVVVAIEKSGGEMPDTSSDAYGIQDFFISPLIKGYAPWRFNIFVMGGGSGSFVVDSIMYRLVECDSVEAFADTGVYIGVSSNSGSFCNNESFIFDSVTGEILPNTANGSVSVVFELPIDKSKADKAKAEELLKQWDIFGDK